MLTRPGTRGKYNDGVYAISLPSVGWEGEGAKEEEMQGNPYWQLADCCERERKLEDRVQELEEDKAELRAELRKWLRVIIRGCSDEDGIDGSWGDKAIARIGQLEGK